MKSTITNICTKLIQYKPSNNSDIYKLFAYGIHTSKNDKSHNKTNYFEAVKSIKQLYMQNGINSNNTNCEKDIVNQGFEIYKNLHSKQQNHPFIINTLIKLCLHYDQYFNILLIYDN
eukprot:382160_1